MTVTIYPKTGKPILIYEATKVEFSNVPETMIPRLVCFDPQGKEVASFMVTDISGHHVMEDETGPSVG